MIASPLRRFKFNFLDRLFRTLRNKEVASVKVLWRSWYIEGATWETKEAMMAMYPHPFFPIPFQLEFILGKMWRTADPLHGRWNSTRVVRLPVKVTKSHQGNCEEPQTTRRSVEPHTGRYVAYGSHPKNHPRFCEELGSSLRPVVLYTRS
ncbi:hypothetical protein MTR67_033938 [Solanum verrucosum]|uniref:Uncharacterized protein n=1 Tax=Solanum verrucosum TaxID=315347 RepID=A0AAF0U6W9_SOLVR|nr:hypothetical protein MTR67_033938 [Solanum verrucosum]